MGATWSRSIRDLRLRGDRPEERRSAGRRGVIAASRSGVRSMNRSSGPATRGKERPAVVGQALQGDGGVLERLALDEPGEQQVALGPERQLVVEVEVVVARAGGAGS